MFHGGQQTHLFERVLLIRFSQPWQLLHHPQLALGILHLVDPAIASPGTTGVKIWSWEWWWWLPSGKQTVCYGK
jgi:hypothetical protein